MYQQKFIKLSSTNKASNNFTTYFNQNLIIPPNSSIALVNANLELNDGFIEISDESENNSMTYSNIVSSNARQFLDHKATIKNGNYTMEDLAKEFTKSLNSRLYFSGNRNDYKFRYDTGSEFKMVYDKSTSKHRLYYSARASTEQTGFDPANVFLGNPARYTYVAPAKSGTLTRTAATIDNIQNDDFCIAKEIFTHGSGIITLTDATSNYSYTFTATADNVLAPDNPLLIANFPYSNDPNNNNNLLNIRDVNGGLAYLYNITQINDDGTNVTSIEVEPNVNTYPNIVNGEQYLVYMNDPVNLQGICCGLIRALDVNSTDIFNDIKYGFMILPRNNTMVNPNTGGTYRGNSIYVKNFGDWYDTKRLYSGGDSIAFILGRLEDVQNMGSANMNDYKMRIAKMKVPATGGSLDQIYSVYLTADYVDDDYIFVYATMQQNGVFNDIYYTESKLINSNESSKYYTDINPELDEIKPIDISSVKYSDGSLGWTPQGVNSYITMNLFNQTTANMLGFATDDQFMMKEQVNNKPDMIVTFESKNPINPNWSLPSDFNISIPNLDIESYLNGTKSSVIYSLGHQIVNSKYFSFTPPEMMFLSLKNISPISLNSLTIRIENDEGDLIVDQANSSVTLCIRTYVK
jgi:hypothetical protein